jgi:hypothetical protein
MKLTRNVILDLLPLYLSDEASPDTQKLVEQQLEADPDLARLAEEWKQRLPQTPPPPANPEAQTLAYQEAKRQIFNRFFFLAAVLVIGTLVIGGAALFGAMFIFFR